MRLATMLGVCRYATCLQLLFPTLTVFGTTMLDACRLLSDNRSDTVTMATYTEDMRCTLAWVDVAQATAEGPCCISTQS